MVAMPRVVSAEEWQRERDALLVAEKEATRALDAIAARRRRLPMVRFDNEKYRFATTDGPIGCRFFEGANSWRSTSSWTTARTRSARLHALDRQCDRSDDAGDGE